MIAAGIVTLRAWQRSDASFVYFSCQDDDVRRWTRLPSPLRAQTKSPPIEISVTPVNG